MERRCRGTNSRWQPAERRCWRRAMSGVWMQQSAMYCGDLFCGHQQSPRFSSCRLCRLVLFPSTSEVPSRSPVGCHFERSRDAESEKPECRPGIKARICIRRAGGPCRIYARCVTADRHHSTQPPSSDSKLVTSLRRRI